MSKKPINHEIHCNVRSCRHHAGEQAYCSLEEINVEPNMNGNTGKPEDESMCGSYDAK